MTQRKIKFRAWSVTLKRMIVVDELKIIDGVNSFGEYKHWFVVTELKPEIREMKSLAKHFNERYTTSGSHDFVMQFTGLLDKNGKEIYEGDIIKGWKNGEQEIREIKWVKSESQNGWSEEHDNKERELEVIGNIIETPDLLK